MSRFHDILGIRPDATQDEIKRAFRERALECHPDRAEEGRKKEAQEEFVRVREAFEVLSDEEKRTASTSTINVNSTNGAGSANAASSTNGTDPDDRSARRRQSYKEKWKKHKNQNQRVRVGKDIVDNVRGLSSEYNLVRQKNRITIPICSLAAALVFVFDPMAINGTGFFIFDVVLCGLVGSVYGFVLGSIWAYLSLFIEDLTAE